MKAHGLPLMLLTKQTAAKLWKFTAGPQRGSHGFVWLWATLVPMGFRASVCIYVIDTNCLPEGERIGSALCGCPTNSGGCCVGRTSERCSVGLEARRRFCPPCGVGQWFISGHQHHIFKE